MKINGGKIYNDPILGEHGWSMLVRDVQDDQDVHHILKLFIPWSHSPIRCPGALACDARTNAVEEADSREVKGVDGQPHLVTACCSCSIICDRFSKNLGII